MCTLAGFGFAVPVAPALPVDGRAVLLCLFAAWVASVGFAAGLGWWAGSRS